ncbi:MAG: regulatory protein GemA [Paracoccus sp.]|jgi:phage gp16-like protein|nr:regulatory protein GemA [Paracoccus sp. (in: a-proteobacteria)]
MSALAAIQIKRRKLGLEDEDWRDIVERVTGQRSTKGLNPKQTRALLGELDRLSGGKAEAARKPLSGPFTAKIQALWISCWNLGLVASRDDKQLLAFVKRQTGIDHANWVLDNADAVRVIEALKSMMTRRGVRWHFTKADPAAVKMPGFQVARAQYALLHQDDAGFLGWLHDETGHLVENMSYADWVPVMNRLGRKVRAAIAAGEISGGAPA